MAAANFEAALTRVLRHEGGYANHPSDPGGPTNFGITQATYARFLGRNVTAAEVRAMPLTDAKAIYRASYWNALRCDELPAGLDYAVFDYGVNSGVGRAATVLARLLSQSVTGRMSDGLVAAARAADAAQLVARLCDERLAFLKSLRTWPVFGAGWGRRVSEVRRDALSMIGGQAPQDTATAPAGGKAQMPPSQAGPATAGAAVIAGGAAATHAAHASGASAGLWLAMLLGGAVAAFALWRAIIWWRKHHPDGAFHLRITELLSVWRDRLKGWRTLVFGAFVAGAGGLLDLLSALQLVDIGPLLPPDHALKIIAAIGVATIMLRLVTTGRVGQRD